LSTLATVQSIFADQTGIGRDDLQPGRPLEELGVDSLTVTETLFLLENEFGIEMPGGQVPIRTIQDIADLIDRLVLQRAAVESEPNPRQQGSPQK
jgi:acyl carrier protein